MTDGIEIDPRELELLDIATKIVVEKDRLEVKRLGFEIRNCAAKLVTIISDDSEDYESQINEVVEHVIDIAKNNPGRGVLAIDFSKIEEEEMVRS